MIDNVAVGTEIRVTTDKWEGAGFGPEKGEIGTVTTSVFTGVDELPVLFSDGVYFVKDGEFETLEDAAFQPGDRVRIVSSPDPLVEVGSEGVVLSHDDPKLFLAILFGGEPPADLNIVDFEDGFIGLKNNELELVEKASATPVVPQPDFAVGTRVRVIDNLAANVEIGDEGNVVDRDDERVDPLAAAFAPDDLVFVEFPGQYNLQGDTLVQVFDPKRLEAITVVDGLDVDPTSDDVPVGTHIILTTDIFKPYATGDRGVVVKHGAYHVVEMEDGGELYLDPSEFTVSEAQPEADLAEWEQELLAAAPVELEAPRLLTDDFVAFELLNAGHFGGTEVQLLHCGGGYYNLAITNGYNRVAPSLTAAERRLLGQALIESAEHGE